MKKLLLLLFFLNSASAQEHILYELHGTVLDGETGRPLYLANVFLSNTTLGSATDRQGGFTITSVRAGSYELVVSMMGYRLESRGIVVNEESEKIFNIVLTPQPLEVPTLTVTAKRDREFKRLLKKTRRFLLGITPNARQCAIENPEVLSITATENDERIDITSSSPLEIVNKALGYRIELYIENFKVLHSTDVNFLVRSRFLPLKPKNPRKLKKWTKNRQKAYRGSLIHFFTALINNRVEEEKFRCFKLKYPPSSMMSMEMEKIDPAAIVHPAESEDKLLIDLPEWTVVLYEGESEVKELYVQMASAKYGTFYKSSNMDDTPAFQTSGLHALASPLKVSRSGHLYGPRLVVTSGHWAFELLADMLPKDYEPFPGNKRTKTVPTVIPAPRLIKRAITLAEKDSSLIEMTGMFYDGLKQLGNDPYADTLYHAVKDIFSVNELKEYKRTEDKGRFIMRVFQQRDPTPATPENERIPVHFQRLQYARRWFRYPSPRGYDDRGEIYVRYGPPDLQDQNPSGYSIHANECWIYWISDGIWFDFIRERGAHYELMTDYPEKLPREFLEQRRHLHYIYTRLASGEATEQEIKDLGIKTFERQARLPHETDFLERHHKKLSCNVSTARFYDYGQTRLELYYAVPFKELQARQQDSLVQDIPLRTSWALRDTTGTVIKNRDGYIMVSQPPDTGYYTDQINIMLSGYTYSLALELQHPFGQAADEEKIETEGFLAGREDLFLSDLQLASNIRTADPDKDKKAYIKHNLCITPYPFSQVERKKMIFVYFEIYNLHLSGGGRTDMEVSYELRSKRTGFLGRINPFSRNRTAYSTSFTQQGGKRNEQVWFALDLSRLKPDHYTIIITVKDEVAGREAKRESVIEVL